MRQIDCVAHAGKGIYMRFDALIVQHAIPCMQATDSELRRWVRGEGGWEYFVHRMPLAQAELMRRDDMRAADVELTGYAECDLCSSSSYHYTWDCPACGAYHDEPQGTKTRECYCGTLMRITEEADAAWRKKFGCEP